MNPAVQVLTVVPDRFTNLGCRRYRARFALLSGRS